MRPTSEELCSRLKREAVFSFLDGDDIAELSGFFDCRQVDAGETLWREGDPCEYLALIVEGKVEIKKTTEFEGKEVVLGVYSSGTIAGEICILDGSPRAVSAVALEDTSLLTLSRTNFETLTREHPDRSVRLLKGILLAVSVRLRKSFERLAAIF